MKSLKNLLKEAINADFAEKKLKPWSNKVSGASGPALEYIKTLEAVLSYLGPTSGKTDAKFDKFIQDRMRRQKSADRMSANPEGEDKKVGALPDPEEMEKAETGEAAPETEPDAPESDEPMATGLPPDSKDDVSGLMGGAPTNVPDKKAFNFPPPAAEKPGKKGKKPAKTAKPKKTTKLPSIKSLTPGAEDPKKKSPGVGRTFGSDGKERSPLPSSPDAFAPKRQVKFKGPFPSSTQNWQIGNTVKVGAHDGFTITGGSAATGWNLRRKGVSYIFVPSANPRQDRGLYKV